MMMNFAGGAALKSAALLCFAVSKSPLQATVCENEEFCLINYEKLCISIEELCIKNDEFCI